MSHARCTVSVKQLPEIVSLHHARLFLRELASNMDAEHPCIVFDCSRILQMDIPAIQFLLDCLEDVMKRNGDIKLAGLHKQPKAMLQHTGADRLFEVFDTNAEAVNSFRPLQFPAVLRGSVPSGASHLTAENAA